MPQSDLINMSTYPVSLVTAEADLVNAGGADSIEWFASVVANAQQSLFTELKLWVFEAALGPGTGEFVAIYTRIALLSGPDNPDTTTLVKPEPYWQYDLQFPVVVGALALATQAALIAAQTFDPANPDRFFSNWGFPLWRIDGGYSFEQTHVKGEPGVPINMFGGFIFQNEATLKIREAAGAGLSSIYGRFGQSPVPAGSNARVGLRDGNGFWRTLQGLQYMFDAGVNPSLLLWGPLEARIFETLRTNLTSYSNGLLLEVPDYFGFEIDDGGLAVPESNTGTEASALSFSVPFSSVWTLLNASMANLVSNGKLNFDPAQLAAAQALLTGADGVLTPIIASFKNWADYQARLAARRSWLSKERAYANYFHDFNLGQIAEYYRGVPNVIG